jgi:hypothetical protein
MSQPVPNGVDVDPRTQQMAGCGMTNHMWTYAFFLKRGRLFTGSVSYPLDESVGAKAGDGRKERKTLAV